MDDICIVIASVERRRSRVVTSAGGLLRHGRETKERRASLAWGRRAVRTLLHLQNQYRCGCPLWSPRKPPLRPGKSFRDCGGARSLLAVGSRGSALGLRLGLLRFVRGESGVGGVRLRAGDLPRSHCGSYRCDYIVSSIGISLQRLG